MTHLNSLRLIATLSVGLHASVSATTLWTESFDSGVSGQSINAAPLNWTRDYGDQFISATPHSGWVGNALTAALATHAPEFTTGASSTYDLNALATSGTLTLSFLAWSYTGTYGSIFSLNTTNGEALGVQSWDNCCLHNVWGVYARPSFTGAAATVDWYTPSDSYRASDVLVSLVVDYDNQLFWATWDGAVGRTESPRLSFSSSLAITSLTVYKDLRGTGGTDVDWLMVQSTLAPVPEPATYGMMLLGLCTLLSRRNARRAA